MSKRYYIITNLEDPNYIDILKLGFPFTGFVGQQLENINNNCIVIELYGGDTSHYDILDPYPEFNEDTIQEGLLNFGFKYIDT